VIRINLLPHREQKRKARATRFAVLAGISVGIGLALVVAGYLTLSAQISTQEERNAFLSEENAKLDKQIAEIEVLKKERQQLLDRKKVVERLQSNRAEAVKIFDQLSRQTPEGVFLRSVRQEGDGVALEGYAQSSARVSTFMRSLNDSMIFEQPNLIYIRADRVGNFPASLFSLKVKIRREQTEEELAAAQKAKKK
jgi:type IV pilus assembly protein PilN